MHSLKRLFRYLGPYWKPLTVTGVLVTIFTVLSLLPPLFEKQIVDVVIGQGDLSRLLPLIAGLVVVYALSELANAGDQYIRHTVGERFLFDLRVRIYDHLQRLSLSFFERTSTGELMSRVTNDVNALEQFVTHGAVLTAMAACGWSARRRAAVSRLAAGAGRADPRAVHRHRPAPLQPARPPHLPPRARPAGRHQRAAAGRSRRHPRDPGVRAGEGRADALQRGQPPLLQRAGQRRSATGRPSSPRCPSCVARRRARAGGRRGDGRAGHDDAGHAGRLPGLHRLLLRSDPPADRGRQHLPAGHRRRPIASSSCWTSSRTSRMRRTPSRWRMSQARSSSRTCISATATATRCCTTSTSTWRRARWSRWSGRAARARRASPTCCAASTIRPTAA